MSNGFLPEGLDLSPAFRQAVRLETPQGGRTSAEELEALPDDGGRLAATQDWLDAALRQLAGACEDGSLTGYRARDARDLLRRVTESGVLE